MWNNSEFQLTTESHHTLRDEIALALFECSLVNVKQHSDSDSYTLNWVKVALQIADVCFKVLDWQD